jgi:hypothetical protein
VIVYVVDSEGLTCAEPRRLTPPTSGLRISRVAFEEDHVNVELPPFVISVGDAFSITVGAAGAGGGAGGAALLATLLWQPEINAIPLTTNIRTILYEPFLVMDSF